MENYRKSAHCTYDMKYHLVWITKYRKPVITGKIAIRTRELIRIICQSNEAEMAVSSLLDDCPRPRQPSHYTDEPIIKILEIACRTPEELGYEASHWSLNLLVDAVIKEGIVDAISAKTVSRFCGYGGNPSMVRLLLASLLRENGFPRNLCGESE